MRGFGIVRFWNREHKKTHTRVYAKAVGYCWLLGYCVDLKAEIPINQLVTFSRVLVTPLINNKTVGY